ncbi:MAG: hypothetical protein ACJARR_004122 [Pseudophaeobacter arcticus]
MVLQQQRKMNQQQKDDRYSLKADIMAAQPEAAPPG